MSVRQLTIKDIVRMIDFSIVTAEVNANQLKEFAENAIKYHFIGAHVLACNVAELKSLLQGHDDILIGSGAGFPDGGHRTDVKIFEAKRVFEDGCNELDMVINIGALRSGRYKYVEDEIRAIVDVAQGRCVKVILEVHYLTDDEIKKGCELCISAGAQFVKTSTGWAPTGATPENVKLIKLFVGDAIQVKAAGGIRSVDTLIQMYKLGATRFGINANSTLQIMEECLARGGVIQI